MRIVVEQLEGLVRQVLVEARKVVDVPAVHEFLGRIPGGDIVGAIIGQPPPPPPPPSVWRQPAPVFNPPPRVPVASRVETVAPVQKTKDAVRVKSKPAVKAAKPVAKAAKPVAKAAKPVGKAAKPVGKSSAVKPPVPAGTRARVLTGSFKGWTGLLQWSPAKSAYNVRLSGPDGQRARTTLSPSKLGKTWDVDAG